MKNKSIIQRVDLQVAVLVAVMVVFSSLVVFSFAYVLSYNQMIASLKDRVNSIANYIDYEIPSFLFTEIHDPEDMNSQAYQNVHTFLSEIREISSAKYLYTATRNQNGKLIYHIDGLPIDDKDFRKPGDLIEPDFQDDLNLALTNTIVMPGVIKNTEWGDVFVAYYPVHDDNNAVVGAIGIEFPASREYQAFKQIRYMTPFVILFTCIATIIISRLLFRRISNPHFKDLSNTDSLTGLKNRNAYDLDMENLIQSKRNGKYALVLADLNGLKLVNDRFGHKIGDQYIKHFAKALEANQAKDHIAYRIGGDEFAIIFFNPKEEEIITFIQEVKTKLKEEVDASIPFCTVAVGYAISDSLDHKIWEKMHIDADLALYQDKRSFYASNQKFDNRR